MALASTTHAVTRLLLCPFFRARGHGPSNLLPRLAMTKQETVEADLVENRSDDLLFRGIGHIYRH